MDGTGPHRTPNVRPARNSVSAVRGPVVSLPDSPGGEARLRCAVLAGDTGYRPPVSLLCRSCVDAVSNGRSAWTDPERIAATPRASSARRGRPRSRRAPPAAGAGPRPGRSRAWRGPGCSASWWRRGGSRRGRCRGREGDDGQPARRRGGVATPGAPGPHPVADLEPAGTDAGVQAAAADRLATDEHAVDPVAGVPQRPPPAISSRRCSTVSGSSAIQGIHGPQVLDALGDGRVQARARPRPATRRTTSAPGATECRHALGSPRRRPRAPV